jgi:hypothetical protein
LGCLQSKAFVDFGLLSLSLKFGYDPTSGYFYVWVFFILIKFSIIYWLFLCWSHAELSWAGPFLMICAEVGVEVADVFLGVVVVASGRLVQVADVRADPITLGYLLVHVYFVCLFVGMCGFVCSNIVLLQIKN